MPDLAALNTGKTDVAEVLTFGREKLARRTMQFGFIAAVVGGLSVFFSEDNEMLTYVGWGLIVFGIGYIAWEFGKTTQPQKPLLVVWSRSVGESVYLIRHTGRSYGTDTSRQRRDHARHPSCDTAIEGSAQRTRRPARAEPEDRCQVAQAGLCA